MRKESRKEKRMTQTVVQTKNDVDFHIELDLVESTDRMAYYKFRARPFYGKIDSKVVVEGEFSKDRYDENPETLVNFVWPIFIQDVMEILSVRSDAIWAEDPLVGLRLKG